MMWNNLSFLFFTPLVAGLFVFLVPRGKTANFKLILVFAGSYLFAITVIHLLPELFRNDLAPSWIGALVLIGFFFQLVLEYFTSGVEHGHIHGHDHRGHKENTSGMLPLLLVTALCLHSFMEGAMLVQPDSAGNLFNVNPILIGILLHRAPAAFALMTVLTNHFGSRRKSIFYLLLFSFSAPLGLLLNTFFTEANIISNLGLTILYAILCGNFLHISTTIVFESSPDHHFNARKLLVALIGSFLAVLVEFIL